MEESLPSDIFPHVYSFLVHSGFLKSAKIFRKEANVPRVVVQSPGLLDFYEAFKKRKNKKLVDVEDSLEPKGTSALGKRKLKDKQSSECPAKKLVDSVLSEDVEPCQEQPSKKKAKKQPAAIVAISQPGAPSKKSKGKQIVKKNESSSSDSDSSEVEEHVSKLSTANGGTKETKPQLEKKKGSVTKKKESSSESSSSSSDSEDDSKETKLKAASNEITLTPVPNAVLGDDHSLLIGAHSVPKVSKKKSKKANQEVNPFRRVDAKQAVDPKLADNSFEAKSGARGSWGERANEVLKFTKGRSFRHEKTKKKRGSYSGGRIDTTVHSIKFDSD